MHMEFFGTVGIHLIKVVLIVLKYCELIWWLQQDQHVVGTNLLSCRISSLNVNYVESDSISYALISLFRRYSPSSI